MIGGCRFIFIHNSGRHITSHSVIFHYMGLKFREIGNKLKDSIRRMRKEKAPEKEKAESVKAPRLSDEAYALLEKLFSELGPRPAASMESRNAARKIAGIFNTFTDDVTVTTGRIIPGLLRWMTLSLVVFSSLVFIFSVFGLPYIAIAAGVFFVISSINELGMKKNPLRSFFPTDDAANVHCVIDPEGEVERTIIFSAHHDTAEMKEETGDGILSRLNLQTGVLSFIGLNLVVVIQIIVELLQGRLFAAGLAPWPILILILIMFSLIALSLYRNLKAGESFTSGAGANLSGVAVISTLGKYFASEKKQGRGCRSTRLVFVSFDGEECGAEGSSIWYRDNSHILVNPVNLNFDGLYSPSELALLSSDGNGFVSLSSSLASRCSMLSSGMGYSIRVGKIGWFRGCTDAVSAAVNGIKATTMTSMADGKEGISHTAEDTPDKVSPEALSIAMSVAIKLVDDAERKDENDGASASLLDNGRKYRLSRY